MENNNFEVLNKKLNKLKFWKGNGILIMSINLFVALAGIVFSWMFSLQTIITAGFVGYFFVSAAAWVIVEKTQSAMQERIKNLTKEIEELSTNELECEKGQEIEQQNQEKRTKENKKHVKQKIETNVDNELVL